jgi:hypothetical protein
MEDILYSSTTEGGVPLLDSAIIHARDEQPVRLAGG